MGCGQTRQSFTYSIPITSPEDAKGETAIYRALRARDGLIGSFLDAPEVKTYQDVILRAIRLYGHKEFLGTRTMNADGSLGGYKWKTYNQVLEIATNLGSGLVNLGLTPPTGEHNGKKLNFIGVYSKNREEWCFVDWSAILYGLTVLPIYDTLGPEAVKFLFDQTDVITVFLSNDHINSLLKEKEAGRTNKLANLIAFENPTPEQKQKSEKFGIKLLTIHDVIEAGKANKQEIAKVYPDSIFTFSYTSGTTGTPKAAMITHGSFVALVGGMKENPDYKMFSTDVYLSYLPLAHSFERVAYCLMISHGAAIGYYNGDVLKLKDDIQTLRPTVFFSVPRLFNRFYDVMKEGLSRLTGTKKNIAEKALATKLDNLRRTGSVTHALYDRIVFKKTREVMGGRLRFMITGSAPISPEVLDFLKVAICSPIVEGYGLTETNSGSFLTYIGDPISGHVGGPSYCTEFKLVDVPEMEYFSTDKDESGQPRPRGEVCIRGPTIFIGYYKDPEKTAEAIDKDGWFHSGDIGQINRNGALKLIDRKKNIFKLAIGEYIAPEKIENIYVTCPSVTECFVYGDSLQHYLVGIIFPDQNYITKLATELGINGSFEELTKNKSIIKKVLDEITEKGKELKLNSFEQVKTIYLETVSFMERDILTPAFKIKRFEARKYYKDIIDQLYKEGLPK